jgi:hypothetical protein
MLAAAALAAEVLTEDSIALVAVGVTPVPLKNDDFAIC